MAARVTKGSYCALTATGDAGEPEGRTRRRRRAVGPRRPRRAPGAVQPGRGPERAAHVPPTAAILFVTGGQGGRVTRLTWHDAEGRALASALDASAALEAAIAGRMPVAGAS